MITRWPPGSSSSGDRHVRGAVVLSWDTLDALIEAAVRIGRGSRP